MSEAISPLPAKFEKPWICLLSFSEKEVGYLKEDYEKLYLGSLGQPIRAKYYRDTFCKFILNYNFPQNIQEYDIFAIDSTIETILEYDSSAHQRKDSKSINEYYFVSEYPQNVFDPRNFAKKSFFDAISRKTKKSVIIVFASKNEEISYKVIDFSGHDSERLSKISTYEDLGTIIQVKNKFGTEFLIEPSSLKRVLERYSKGLDYHVVFNPDEYQVERFKIDFTPLIHNIDGEIISFYLKGEKSDIIIVPDLQDKASFLKEMFSDVLPELYPELFPFSEKNNWLNKEAYAIPNQKELLNELDLLEQRYLAARLAVDRKIEKNKIEFSFLHDLISGTDDVLVIALIKYFNWLGIDQVVNKDETASILKEEDIQLIHNDLLIVVEAKGIFGTSKDEDCSQVAKIRFRRMKELKRTDIYALYIVNHQRRKPPLSRDNPPFKPHQIMDAEEDDRGLLTTWQLFKAYQYVVEGIFSKSDVINQLSKTGVINFEPLSNYKSIGVPKEVHHKGEIIIVDLNADYIKVGDKLLVSNTKQEFKLVKILSINLHNESIDSMDTGEAGIKVVGKISISDTIWVKRQR